MKGNLQNLVDLAEQVQGIEDRKQDFFIKSEDMSMVDDEKIVVGACGTYDLNKVSHSQVADRLGIPAKYYSEIKKIPGLRAYNVTALLHHRKEKNLVRTLDGTARAFLSDRFRPIDNYLILNGFLPVVKEMNMQVKACSLSEEKMYLQVVFPQIRAEVKRGDVVNLGIILTNSEVGRGSVDISTVVWRMVCSNGMIGESLLSKYHVGRRVGDDIADYDIFQDDTIRAELESFRLRLRDVFAAATKEAFFQNIVEKMKVAAGDEIRDSFKTFENVTKRYVLSQAEQTTAMNGYIKDGQLNRWGLANSITALAHDIESPERQHDLEKIGYDIITLSPSQWEEVAA